MSHSASQLKVMPDLEPDRKSYLGSSNAAAVMGLGAYGNTPLTCYLAKIGEGQEEMDPKQRLFLERRKRWECPIVEMLKEEFGGNVVAINRRYIDEAHPFMAAEIDFEWADADGVIQNGEIKTVSPFAFGEKHGWGEAGTDQIPVHYAAQVMFALMVTGRQSCIVAAMVGLDQMTFYRIERDEEVITEMRARCAHFWEEHVIKRVPPDPISLEDCMRLTLRMKGRPIEADDELFEHLRDLNGIREEIRTLEGNKDEVMFQIASAILKSWGATEGEPPTDNAIILRAGQEFASWNLQRTTRVDAKRLKSEAPDVFAKFSKTTPSRVLRFKKQKT